MSRFTIAQRASFLGDAVFGASDGIVTTFAIVAGSNGASLPISTIVILGFANLFADGFSMAAGNYLGRKSESEYEASRGDKVKKGLPWTHAFVTFMAFNLAGFIPLIPFVFGMDSPFLLSTIYVAVELFTVGAIRGRLSRNNWIRDAFETLIMGGLAATVAFLVGMILDKYVV